MRPYTVRSVTARTTSSLLLPAAHASADASTALWPLATIWSVAFGAVLTFLWPLALLYDSDSYYHLAIARAYLQEGLLSELPWARFSAMSHGFGDKELLFHLLLLPAAALPDPVLGAKVTLAALDATILTSLACLARRAVGPTGLVLPALALFGSLSFDLRVIRLRPELLALFLLLWTVHALSTRRAALAGLCACAFALAYTAFHALLGVCALCFVLHAWLDRKPSYRLLGYPVVGATAGLLVHPHFPHNLRIFYLQNVEFWRYQHTSDVGNEILPLGVARWLSFDWPLLIGCAILAATLRRAPRLDRAARVAGLSVCVCALPFMLLFVHSSRFAVYALPLALLAAAWLVRLLGFQLDARLWLRGEPGPRSALALGLLACIAVPHTAAALEAHVDREGCLWPALRNQLARLARALPDGAKVAATWDSSEDYIYFAPQGRYLNLLDPLFMRSAHPRAYESQRALFAGERADVPLTLRAELDSDYLAFAERKHPALQARLESDPRLEALVREGHALYRVRPDRASSFVRDFRVAASRALLSQPTAARYPRHASRAGREIEAIVDTARVSERNADGCTFFGPLENSDGPGRYELGTSAPTRVWIGEQAQTIASSARVLIGSGSSLHVPALADVAIELCSEGKPAQFYLLRRD